MPRLTRLLTALLAAALGSAALAPAAFGHASFVGADPAPGTRLEAAPARITLTFSEGLNRHLTRATVVDTASGRAVPAGRRFAGARSLVLVPRAALRRGAYRVDWQSVSTDDGHPLEGSFGFGVRAAAASGSGSVERSPLASGGWARALARWALYAALLLFTGGLLARALLGRRWPADAGGSVAGGPPSPAAGRGPGARDRPGEPSLPGGGGRAEPVAEGNGRPVEAGGGVAVATTSPPRERATSPQDGGVDRAVAARADAVLADAGVAALALGAVAAALEAALAADELSAAALRDYLLANFAGVARIAVVGLVALALALARRAPRAAALAAAAAVAALVASGHAHSADPRGVAIVSDIAHLLAAAVWLGGAAVIVLAWGPALRDAATRRRVAMGVLPRFGRVALPAFGVVVIAGVVNAIVELGRVSALWQTAYGAVLLVKIGLVAAVATLAWLHAYRLRPRLVEAAEPGDGPGDPEGEVVETAGPESGGGEPPARALDAERRRSPGRPRPAAPDGERWHWRALRGEPLLAVGVVGAAALLVAFPLPPRQLDQASHQAGRLPACTSCPLPAPARDELSVAAQAGSQTVAVWVRRRGGALSGTVRALDFRGRPVAAPPRVPGARTAPCGPGCATFALAAAPARLVVEVRERGHSYAAHLPVRWDLAATARARRLLDRAQRTMRDLRSVVEDERVTSGPGTLAVARYRLRAPDRLAYRTGAGVQSVQIGPRQWVRIGGDPWTETPAAGGLPFRTRTWFRWTPYARAVALLDQRAGIARLALMDPGTPVWVRLSVQVGTGRVVREQLVAPARFIDHRFQSFDRPVRIVAPRGAIRGD